MTARIATVSYVEGNAAHYFNTARREPVAVEVVSVREGNMVQVREVQKNYVFVLPVERLFRVS